MDFNPSPSSILLEVSEPVVCFNVSITRDGLFEEDKENFTILLSSLDTRVTINPDAVEVVIFDQDGMPRVDLMYHQPYVLILSTLCSGTFPFRCVLHLDERQC